MEAENKIARLKAKLRFTLVFAIALIVAHPINQGENSLIL